MANKPLKTGPAIWRNSSGDQPVWLTGDSYNSKVGGRYWGVEGSGGIPEAEIFQDELNEVQREYLRKNSESFRKFEQGAKVEWNKTAAKATSEAAKNLESTTVKEAAGEVSEATIKSANRLSKEWKFGRKAGVIGLAAFGIASVADLAMDAGEHKEAKRQQHQQRKRQDDKDKRNKKYNYAGSGYQPETFDGFVQEMFNQRTGHTKMGNAKFN